MAITPDTPKKAESQAVAAAKDVAARVDEALEKGFIGNVPDPVPNEAYSLLSGPDGPPLVEDNQTRVAQPQTTQEKS